MCPEKEILELVTGITPAKMTEVANHLNVVEADDGMPEDPCEKNTGKSAHI